MIRLLLGLPLALSLITLAPAPLRAEPTRTSTSVLGVNPVASSALALEASLAFSPTPSAPDVSTVGLSGLLGARYRRPSGLEFGLDLGLSGVSLAVAGRETVGRLALANVLLGVGYRRALGPEWRGAAGLRVGAPLATFPGGIAENRATELAHLVAASARGFRDPFPFLMNVIPVVLDLSAEHDLSRWLRVSGELAAAALVSVNVRPSRLALRAALEAEASFEPFSVRSRLNYLLSTLALENHDLDQLSAGLGLGLALGAHTLRLDFNFGLDEPYGVTRDSPAPTWGMVLGAELDFEL